MEVTSIFYFMPIVGRVFVGFYFVFFGFWNMYHWSPTVEAMKHKRLFMPKALLAFGIMWQSVAGLMIIAGFYVPFAALSLIPFTLIAICTFHTFWQLQGEARVLNMLIFMTNLTVTTGALLLLVT